MIQRCKASKDASECECAPRLEGAADALQLFTEGDDLYRSMLSTIAKAQQRIQLESYIFANDEIGRRFVAALAERAQAGVGVFLHLDASGSLFLSDSMLRALRKQGVKLRWFHRWSWRRPLRYNHRNHRKLLVVDGSEAWLGGFNIHRQSSLEMFGVNRWRDTHVRMEAELASQAEQLFERFWQGDHRWVPPKIIGSQSELVPNYSRDCRQRLRCIFTDMFSSASRSIHLTTPYFVPDRHTQRQLKQAARRGVEVCVLVPRKSDVWLARWAGQAAYADLLASGVKIYEYLPRMLHSKMVVTDGNYATVGTANIDYRSFFLNHELNLFTRDQSLCMDLQKQFYRDLDDSEEISFRYWKRRFWGGRLFELIGWMARRWL